MTNSRNRNTVNVEAVLRRRRQVAVIWGVDDVQAIRPDLDRDQAWQVLQEARDRHDGELGFNWLLLETVAGNLFPQLEISCE
jgi:hypothetical protein